MVKKPLGAVYLSTLVDGFSCGVMIGFSFSRSVGYLALLNVANCARSLLKCSCSM